MDGAADDEDDEVDIAVGVEEGMAIMERVLGGVEEEEEEEVEEEEEEEEAEPAE